MALKRNTWRPDTCDCVIDYEWDDAVPLEDRAHVPVKVEACALHQPPPEAQRVEWTPPAAVYATVLAENQKKNRAIGALLARTDFDLAPQDVGWRFDEGRRLHLAVQRPAWLRTADKPAMQAALRAAGFEDVEID